MLCEPFQVGLQPLLARMKARLKYFCPVVLAIPVMEEPKDVNTYGATTRPGNPGPGTAVEPPEGGDVGLGVRDGLVDGVDVRDGA